MKFATHERIMIAAVGTLGLLAIVQLALADHRPSAPDLRAATHFAVTSGADRGPGTLREAIFAANATPDRSRITIRVPRIEVRTPLPPIANPEGVVIVSEGSTIDAAALTGQVVIDIHAPHTSLRNIAITNAGAVAVMVRADGARLEGLDITHNQVGVQLTPGSAGMTIEQSRFERNDLGIRLDVSDPATTIRDNTFTGHTTAGIWAIGGHDIRVPNRGGYSIRGNTFESDNIAMVLGNLSGTVSENDIAHAQHVGIYIAGSGVLVQNNRVRVGERIGILAATTADIMIADNEVDHNRVVGLLLSNAANTRVIRNRSYSNGYGIIIVFGTAEQPNVIAANTFMSNELDGVAIVGGSPLLRDNNALGNRHAGLRVLDYFPPDGVAIPAKPFLEHNRLNGNGVNDPIRGAYRSP